MRSAILVAVSGITLLSGCSIQDARTAADARSALVGTTQADLDMCAGVPTKTDRPDPATEIRSYEYTADASKALNLTLPAIGGISMGSSGYCHANFKLVKGRVTALGYAGDTDSGLGGTDAMCAALVRHCVASRGG
jgi:hypothetical protein